MPAVDWATCNNPEQLLNILEKHAPKFERVVRLFACSCCRLLWREYKTPKIRAAIESVERFALGEPLDLDAVSTTIHRGSRRSYRLFNLLRDIVFDPNLPRGNIRTYGVSARNSTSHELREQEFGRLPPVGGYPPDDPLYDADRLAMERINAQLAGHLRCIAGNPLAPVTMNTAWLTPAVVGVATTLATSWDFNSLPVLADALEEAGCDNATVLEHCRGSGPHVRGCWVVRMVLGKE